MLRKTLPLLRNSPSYSSFCRRYSGLSLKLQSVGISVKNLKKIDGQNEDAFFISDKNNAIGVFDGVGSWSFEGKLRTTAGEIITSAHFAQSLSKYSLAAASLSTPSAIIDHAWKETCRDSIPGSSSATILKLAPNSRSDGKGALVSAQIGDCCFLVFSKRGGKYEIIHRSDPMMHHFNCPYQMGITPELKVDQFDSPASAREEQISVSAGDILLLASDGLFSNLFENQILEILQEYNSQPKQLVERLVEESNSFSTNKMVDSPFALSAKEANICWSKGGRPDDTTIVVSQIVHE